MMTNFSTIQNCIYIPFNALKVELLESQNITALI